MPKRGRGRVEGSKGLGGMGSSIIESTIKISMMRKIE